MKGFKSYGNRKISVPLHKGFTCVVGPNGSGKSNIFDAISFVLGRMSAKSMRAGSISDLVFAGTEKHRRAEYADVCMYFDNTDQIFPFEKDEVIISRKVDKSGKGVYRVNNKRETRTFVVDLLNLVGLTPDGYNMIAQGDITRFVKMSSFDRRAIIEEISGIQEYDEKKEKGLRELAKAEENIARVELVVNEVRSQLNRLENEKNDALRYQYLKDEISRNKGDLIFGELDDSTNEYKKIEAEISRNEALKISLADESNNLHDEIHECETRLEEREEELEKKSEHDYVDITREIVSLTSRRDTLNLKKEMKVSAKNANITRKENIISILSDNETQISNAKNDLKSFKEKRDSVNEEISKNEEIYSEVVENLEKTSSKFFDYKKEADELEKNIGKIKDEEYNLSKEISTLSERIKANGDSISTIEGRIEDLKIPTLEDNINGLKGELDAKESRLNELDVDSIKEEEFEITNHFEAIEKKIVGLNRTITEYQSRIGRKNEQREVHGKNISSIDEILRIKDKGQIKGIIGKFSDLGKTNREYAVALEVAAGSRMKNIVVEDSEVARACVKHLKERKLGRLTFLPLNELSPNFMPDRFKSNLGKSGAIDFAINLVSFNEKHRKAFEYVFSNTLIIKNIEDSKSMMRQRMVTLDGDIIESSGAITGGYWKPRKFLESFETKEDEEEIVKMEQEKRQFELKRDELKQKIAEIRDKKDTSSKEEAKLSAEISSLKLQITDLDRLLDSNSTKRTSFIAQIKNLSSVKEELEGTVKEKEDNLKSILQDLEDLQTKKEGIDSKVEEYRSEGVEHSQELNKMIRELRVERDGIISNIYALDSKIKSLSDQNESLEMEQKDIDEKVSDLNAEIESLSEDIIKVEKELEDEKKKELAIATVLKDIKSQRDKLRSQILSMREKREKTIEKASSLDAAVKVMEVNLSTLKERIEALEIESKEYIRPETSVKDLKELRFRITRMEKEKEGLEPINMRAIEEYDDVEDRYLMLSSKRDKLTDEKNSILSFIDEIEAKKRDVFMQAFSVVKDNFSIIFEQLSPDGEGNLVLEDDEDPFSGGLFIEARPAGKELNRTESMSGGEKALTALAFVFAIQKFKPAPFYILDEIDAHLDDDNVRKVSELIKKSSDTSQFIVITHRDVMMTAADRLFGTSVAKDKISKIVSVELEKVSDVTGTERYGVAET